MVDKKGLLQKMLLSDEKPQMGSDKPSLEAKLAAMQQIIDALRAEVTGKAKGDLAGLQKVEVMAPDKEGLKEGLDLAAEMAAEKGGSLMDESDMTGAEEEELPVEMLKDSAPAQSEELTPEDEVSEEPVSHDTFGRSRASKSPKYY